MREARHDQVFWSPVERLGFRFIFLLFLLFIAFFNNGAYPLFKLIIYYPSFILHKLLTFLSVQILQLDYPLSLTPNGSGDTSYSYFLLLFISVISLLGCLVWTLIDRKSNNYQKLYYWLTVAVRFYLGLMLIQYGLVKVIKMQFPFPDLNRLSSYYGDSSPMGLAWTFLGYSKGYNIFMGVAELMGFLLLFRRTLTLGALISLATTANIMAVNYFYDVPVKILSTALFVMSIYLLTPNITRLRDLFLGGKSIALRNLEPPVFSRSWMVKYSVPFKILLITMPFLFTVLTMTRAGLRTKEADRLPFYGAYFVEKMEWKEQEGNFDKHYQPRWHKLIIQREDHSQIGYPTGEPVVCGLRVDTLKKLMHMSFPDDPDVVHSFNYKFGDSTRLFLSGRFFGDSLEASLVRRDFELVKRGFHWINEYPYNK